MREVAGGLAEYADIHVIGPRGCRDFLPSSAKITEVPESLTGFLIGSLLHGITLRRKEHFDLVIGGSGLAALCITVLQRLYDGNTTVFLHGLDLIVPHKIYQAIFIPAIQHVDLVIANSRNTARLATSKGVEPQRIQIINPGCHAPDESASARVEEFRQRHHLAPGPLMLFVGRITRRKGLSRFIAQCLPTILTDVPDSQMIVVGDEPSQALDKSGEKKDVMQCISEMPLGLRERIQFLGSLNDEDLNTCYAAATVHVFPIVETPGDVEGFGMVAIEAASYGTPTVAFRVGGVPDAVGQFGGHLIDGGDYRAFENAVTDILRKPDAWRLGCLEHARRFSWEHFNKELRNQIERIAGSQPQNAATR